MDKWRYPSRWSARDVQVIAVGCLLLTIMAAFYLLFERAGPEERDARPSVQPVQQQMERLWQKREIDDQEMRIKKLERDLWERENERRMETLKFFGDK